MGSNGKRHLFDDTPSPENKGIGADWDEIVKYEHEKYQEEKNKEKRAMEEKKKMIKEILDK